ncbi:NEDD8-conjugating enzyme Ubc12-like isoform X1 [Malus sylvestris]|uniref:NEDD8-conjugating enzyme Ubc12-like isoform X1 n=1 Tax=Malus sylvestris TaxID=3752 RepID=UPI0010AB275F|nr:NEDD8-conjugating enzyme Ubc12-like [Malus domestica]XP_050136761.1 NEDD8-conjugating enzyme Ubc12-like isoform X1 [Malus sylvestris]
MIRLFKVKEKQKETAENAKENGLVKKQSAGELRLHRDISELNMPEECKISFPKGKDDLMDFEITITPYRGYYMGGGFVFTFKVPAVYPHEPPKVKCKTKEPNIDLEAGAVAEPKSNSSQQLLRCSDKSGEKLSR